MRIKAIRFEPGTITTSMKRLDVVHAEDALLQGDTIGVRVDDDFVPWHRVQSVKYEEEPHEAPKNPEDMTLPEMQEEMQGLADQHAVLEAQKHAALRGGKAASVAVANDMRRQAAKKKGQS